MLSTDQVKSLSLSCGSFLYLARKRFTLDSVNGQQMATCNLFCELNSVLSPTEKNLATFIVAKKVRMCGVKRATSPFNLFFSNVAKQEAHFLLPVLLWLN